jgi:hypothetical protein
LAEHGSSPLRSYVRQSTYTPLPAGAAFASQPYKLGGRPDARCATRGLQGEFGSATNPSASAVISTWLFVAVRQCESCPDPGLGCCDSYLNLGFTKSTVRLSLTDYNKSPPDCNVECGSCSLRLLLAIEISPPAHAITSPPAPTCAAIDLVRFDHARCIFWDRCVSNRKLLNTYFGDIAVLYLVIPAVMRSSPNGD